MPSLSRQDLINTPSFRSLVMEFLLPPAFMAVLVLWALQVSYLLFHTVAELISIVIALMAMVVASISLGLTRNHFSLSIAVAMGWCSGLDLLHALAYQGVGLLPFGGSNTAAQLWIAARLIQAVALVSAPLWLTRPISPFKLHLVFGSLTGLAVLAITSGYFPVAFIDGQGQTAFKIASEYLVILLLCAAGFLYWQRRRALSTRLLVYLFAAVLAMVASECAFAQYATVYAVSNLLGHMLKITAYWFMYLALVHNTLREPFDMLSRVASTYDTIPDPTLVIDGQGFICQANAAAARSTQQPTEHLIGQSSHELFHDTRIQAYECPVCQRIANNQVPFVLELTLEQGLRTIECSVATAFNAPKKAFVQVIRDITERKHLEHEREQLLQNLGDRVKELRCMHAIGDLIDQPGIGISHILRGVVDLLPTAFRYPDSCFACIDSQWGWFGPNQPDAPVQHKLEYPLLVAGHPVGHLSVWYFSDVEGAEKDFGFLSEERALLENVVFHLSETLERLLNTEQIRRLSYMYEMLSATNRAVIRSTGQDELLNALFDALNTHDAFPIRYMALTDTGGHPLRCVRSQGIPDALIPELKYILEDPNLYQGHLQDCISGKVVYVQTQQLNTQNSPAWRLFLQQQNIQGRALVPLITGGTLIGLVAILSRDTSFDQAQLSLLQDMASDIAYGLDTMATERRRLAAEHQATLSEHRFHEVFNASPVPLQIVALETLEIRLVNAAFEQWLGFSPPEVVSMEHWFECVFPDSERRDALWYRWGQDLVSARAGQVVTSSEILLTDNKGQQHTAQCSLTLIKNDLVMAWTDLTAIRNSERTLRESEQRFRSMIEQTVSGIFVSRDDQFIYVNPKLCQMLGWAAEELLHMPLHQLVTQADARCISSACHECAPPSSGLERSSCEVPIRCKDGHLLDVDLRFSQVLWDDGLPATIVLAQDVSERKQTEAQIAHYIEQLEGVMKGTLQAVSNMLEMRDPYTAGHERRVGLIARALGEELGWSEERCETLEMAGLVHDIGKIAIPAEILSKPSRLTALELEMVRGHAQAGYDILKNVPFTRPIADIIHQHHERMNGSGYPQQLKANDILPEARVLAVADVIESMAAHRPYRPALGVKAALDEIEHGKNTLYDAAVVEAAQRLICEKHYQLPA